MNKVNSSSSSIKNVSRLIKINGIDTYEFQHTDGIVKHSFFKREIPFKIDGETYYDLISPFSMGGPVIIGCDEDYKWELVDEFGRAFQEFCKVENIICESIGFNTSLDNLLDFACCYIIERYDGIIESYHLEVDNSIKISEPYVCNTNYDYGHEVEFFKGQKIWNLEIYEKACLAADVGLDGDYFPAYRLKENNMYINNAI